MSSVFYNGGLRFTCTRCSHCCRHAPGFVFLSQIDLDRLAGGLGIDVETCTERYCRRVPIGGFTRLCLEEKANYDCVFWEEGGCSVYEYRPLQCRSYPFWSANLEDSESWESVKADCPGAGSGTMHTRAEIEKWLAARLREPLLS